MLPSAGPESASLERRAALAVALWLGFWALGAATVAFLLWVPWLDLTRRQAPSLGGVICGLLALWIVRALLPRREPFVAPGAVLVAADSPALFRLVAEVASQCGQRTPGDVFLIPDANALVAERFDGFWAPRRPFLAVGLGMLAVLDVDELRAVIAHEFGHRLAGDVRLGPWVHHTRASIAHTLAHLGALGPLRAPFEIYGRFFLRVSRGVSRDQEFAADALAARVAGAGATASAVARVHEEGLLWDVYWQSTVLPVLETGVLPPILEGFARYRVSTLAADWRREAGRQRSGRRATDADSHPPVEERVRALIGDRPPTAVRSPSALTLLPDVRRIEERLVRGVLLGAETVPIRDPGAPEPVDGTASFRRCSWEDVGTLAWLPRFRREVLLADRIDARTLLDLPAILRSPASCRALLPAAGPHLTSPDARSRAGRELLARALFVRLAAAGWTLVVLPGERPYAQRPGDRVDVYPLLADLDSGRLSAVDYAESLRRWLQPPAEPEPAPYS